MTGSAVDEDFASGIELPPNVKESEKFDAGMDTTTNPVESQTPDFPLLGPILVVGGCGYEMLSSSIPMVDSSRQTFPPPLKNSN